MDRGYEIRLFGDWGGKVSKLSDKKVATLISTNMKILIDYIKDSVRSKNKFIMVIKIKAKKMTDLKFIKYHFVFSMSGYPQAFQHLTRYSFENSEIF